MRKGLIITFIIMVIGGAALYLYGSRKTIPTDTPPGATTFFPTDGSTDGGLAGIVGSDTSDTTDQTASITRFKQLSPGPIAGFTAFTETTTKTTPSQDPKEKPTTESVTDRVIRYISRGNGYVYEIRNSAVPLQISNIYIPNIYEGYFGDANNTAILRFLRDDQKTIATYSVPIPGENPDGSRTQKQGVYFPDQISTLAVAADQKQLAYLTSDGQNSIITTATAANGGKKELLRNPFHEWLIIRTTPQTTWVQTKAASTIEGFLYKIDATDRRLVRALGNVRGLTTSVSPSGTYILYSQSTTTGFLTRILNTKTGAANNIGLTILPEKCTWLKNEDLICAGNNQIAANSYPDAWYAGLISFKDKFYHIYTASNTYTILSDGTERTPDATHLHVNEEQGIVLFIDKPTGLLWQLSF